MLEIQDHARLIDHHAAHTSSSNANNNPSTPLSSGAAASRALAAGIWTTPAPAHGVRGGEVSSEWTNQVGHNYSGLIWKSREDVLTRALLTANSSLAGTERHACLPTY